MKRWLWLLAVPWVVSVSTSYPEWCQEYGTRTWMGGCNKYPSNTVSLRGHGVEKFILTFVSTDTVDFARDKEFFDDIAEALNAAHERRTKKEPDYMEMSKEEFERLLDEVQDGGGKCK